MSDEVVKIHFSGTFSLILVTWRSDEEDEVPPEAAEQTCIYLWDNARVRDALMGLAVPEEVLAELDGKLLISSIQSERALPTSGGSGEPTEPEKEREMTAKTEEADSAEEAEAEAKPEAKEEAKEEAKAEEAEEAAPQPSWKAEEAEEAPSFGKKPWEEAPSLPGDRESLPGTSEWKAGLAERHL